jgi:hypothetical protein
MTTHNTDSELLPIDSAVEFRRPPATAIVATVLTVLLASAGTYGALYFSGLDGYDPVDATFLSMYGYLSAMGIVAVIAQLRGSAIGRAGVIAWGTMDGAVRRGEGGHDPGDRGDQLRCHRAHRGHPRVRSPNPAVHPFVTA